MARILLFTMLLAAPAEAQSDHAMSMDMPMSMPTKSEAKPAPSGKTRPARKSAEKDLPAAPTMAKMQVHGDVQHDAVAQPDENSDEEGMAGRTMTSRPADIVTPTKSRPPPPEAGTGPARAADAVWGADAMRTSREALTHGLGGQTFAKLMIDRIEYRARSGRDGYAWEGQAWYGDDIDKLWIRSEGEGSFGGQAEQAEVDALWSHAISPWFDLQTGLRHDFVGPGRTHAVVGVHGLAPYQFEIDAAAYLSDKGDLTARAEAELDQRITQRLIVQPRAEVNLSAQRIPALGIGSGLDRAEVGIRLRYEFAREFAPYVGVSHEWLAGGSADYARSRGADTVGTDFVFGLRAWF
ncbi:copper resistance protein B [Stakelama sp. CBK3Z-3]|uniref:Copper resistance protein B n=2 Tax=Stakelama flava TaxID=2860338 RepID=A0ABS6XKU8_9SPHN|nr:copper resistance protein B [Stakelama flava]MBW4330805.1 copper resistance protein B [Stakelama flava]